MLKPLALLKLVIFSSFSLLPERFLRVIEMATQSAQGKGWMGGVEKEIRAIQRLARETGIVDIVAMDVGANVGGWTLALKKSFLNSEVHAFEPNTEAFERLKSRLEAVENVHLYHSALGRSVQKATLYFDQPASTKASLTRRRLDHIGVDLSLAEEIQITTLDAWQDEFRSLAPNILKLDTEGHEYEILKGGETFLKSIKIVQFEFGGADIDSRVFFQDFWYFFHERDFEVFRLAPRGLRKVTRYDEMEETFRFTTLYAVRRKK